MSPTAVMASAPSGSRYSPARRSSAGSSPAEPRTVHRESGEAAKSTPGSGMCVTTDTCVHASPGAALVAAGDLSLGLHRRLCTAGSKFDTGLDEETRATSTLLWVGWLWFVPGHRRGWRRHRVSSANGGATISRLDHADHAATRRSRCDMPCRTLAQELQRVAILPRAARRTTTTRPRAPAARAPARRPSCRRPRPGRARRGGAGWP